MSFEEDISTIEKFQKEIIMLSRISALMQWDNQTYMPKDANEERADQMSYLSEKIHEKMVDDSFWEAVQRLKGGESLDERQRRMVEILYKDISKSKRLPKEFVAEMAKERSLSFNAWQKAREEMDADVFLPHLSKIVELKRKEVGYRGFEGHPYNTLLDDYEEGMTVEKLDPVFDKLKKGLIELLDKIKSSDNYSDQKKVLISGEFDKDNQIKFTNEISQKLGLKDSTSRLDLSEHPFTTTLGLRDVRITTNVRDDPLFSIGSTIHEAGHALYELGMPDDEQYTVLGDAPSLGLHESQSRFWENMVGLGKSFWKHFFPRVRELFDLDDQIDLWHREINQVFPHYIRIESDEVHYCLHVILRYELEKGLIDGSISVDNVAEEWNKKVKEYFDLDVRNPKEGFMQDVHWSEGYFGYFPTYALGTIYAAQIYAKLVDEMEDAENHIAEGSFDKIKDWLRDRIHKYGSMGMADDIITGVCGKGLDADDFLEYLNKKYGELYGF